MVFRFLKLLNRAFWKAFEHDALSIAKGAAYSSILTLFPALMMLAAILATTHTTEPFIRQISYAVGRLLPPGNSAAIRYYFEGTQKKTVGLLVPASLITLWTASGVMISWMEGFRAAYQLPKIWGLVKERAIAFLLVIMAGIPLTFATILVAFGNQIERWMIFHSDHELGAAILLLWAMLRWLISILTSIAVLALIYHHAVPRTQPWHSVLPGATLATAAWFPATMLFGWYVRHYANYSLFYGSLATAIVLLAWLYIVSVLILVGAEFNALLFPRVVASRDATVVAPDPRVLKVR